MGASLFDVASLPRKPSGFREPSSARENSRFHPFPVRISTILRRYKNTDPNTGQYFYGGVGGLSAKLVWCVESFFEGLAKCDFEASGSGSDLQNETNKTQKDPLSPCLNYGKMGKVRAYLRYEQEGEKTDVHLSFQGFGTGRSGQAFCL